MKAPIRQFLKELRMIRITVNNFLFEIYIWRIGNYNYCILCIQKRSVYSWEEKKNFFFLHQFLISPQMSTIYIGNLPNDVTESEIKKVFSNYGAITQVTVKHPREKPSIAFVV